tara:strand:+ start:66 stop:365 length:300 start_codon:yes stop_codon:yes gene_type:complete
MAKSETSVTISDSQTATAGTGSALNSGTAQRVKSVSVVAKDNNTSAVYFGGSDVDSDTVRGLGPGDSLSVTAVNWVDLATFFIDVAVSGEGVDYYAIKA